MRDAAFSGLTAQIAADRKNIGGKKKVFVAKSGKGFFPFAPTDLAPPQSVLKITPKNDTIKHTK